MNQTLKKVVDFLTVVPVVAITIFTNMTIAFIVASVTFIQLISNGWNKDLSLGIAIVIAIGVHVYIAVQPKIKNYIDTRS